MAIRVYVTIAPLPDCRKHDMLGPRNVRLQRARKLLVIQRGDRFSRPPVFRVDPAPNAISLRGVDFEVSELHMAANTQDGAIVECVFDNFQIQLFNRCHPPTVGMGHSPCDRLVTELRVGLMAEATFASQLYANVVATIIDPQLSIQLDRAAEMATVSVTCGLEFTDFEVRSMNLLGTYYTLECELLNMEMLYPHEVINFVPRQFPRVRDGATTYEEPVFEAVAPTKDLHLYIFGKDSLAAELRLSNEDLGTLSVKRTPVVLVDLAA